MTGDSVKRRRRERTVAAWLTAAGFPRSVPTRVLRVLHRAGDPAVAVQAAWFALVLADADGRRLGEHHANVAVTAALTDPERRYGTPSHRHDGAPVYRHRTCA